jgi:serine/threonine protein kinase
MNSFSDKKACRLIYKKGDFIGQEYEIYDVLGMGGFGVVYLAYSHETKQVYALKTFRDEYLEDAETRNRFRKEAHIWINLGNHPYLVRAYFVQEIQSRLYIIMQYIAPNEAGLNSLEGYLNRKPPDLAQSLRWGIQFCHGMEYAYSKGIRAHRDIKPANIMIGQDKTIKISDFGLAGVLATSSKVSRINLSIQRNLIGLSCQKTEGIGFGTPTHMPSEQFSNAADCNEKSDIYSFGVVLYQMATGGRFPFFAPLPKNNSKEEGLRFWWAMYKLQKESPLAKVKSPIFPVIQHCLEKEPSDRYITFKDLRSDLEVLLREETGEIIKPQEIEELKEWDWYNKGTSLVNLSRLEEGMTCYDRILDVNPQYVHAWLGKGVIFAKMGRSDEAFQCFNKALTIDPIDTWTWCNKGVSLADLGRFDEATQCFNKALEIDPQNPYIWRSKGSSLCDRGRFDEAIQCFDRALKIDSRDFVAWYDKGTILQNLGRFDEAIQCFDKAIEIYPLDAYAFNNKGVSLYSLGRLDEAVRSYNRALEIDEKYEIAWYNKALSEDSIGRKPDAVYSFKKFISLAVVGQTKEIQYAQRRLQKLEE